MAVGNLAVDPVMQLATIGVLGVGALWPLLRRSSCWRVQSRFTFPCWVPKFHVVSVYWWHSQVPVVKCWSSWRDYLANGWLPWVLQMAR